MYCISCNTSYQMAITKQEQVFCALDSTRTHVSLIFSETFQQNSEMTLLIGTV